MKREEWGRVKLRDVLIYADPYEGVFKATVLQVDIRFYEAGGEPFYLYPYGKTAEKGTVEIKVDSRQLIVNLRDLIPWSQERFLKLQKVYAEVTKFTAKTEGYRAEFRALVGEYLA